MCTMTTTYGNISPSPNMTAFIDACVKISDKDIENDRRTNEDWYQHYVKIAEKKIDKIST